MVEDEAGRERQVKRHDEWQSRGVVTDDTGVV